MRALVTLAARAIQALEQLAKLLTEIRELLQDIRLRSSSPDFPLTIEEGARFVRMRSSDFETWATERGIVQHFDGRPRIRSSDLWRVTDEAERARKELEARRERRDQASRKTEDGIPSWEELQVSG